MALNRIELHNYAKGSEHCELAGVGTHNDNNYNKKRLIYLE